MRLLGDCVVKHHGDRIDIEVINGLNNVTFIDTHDTEKIFKTGFLVNDG